MKRPVLYAMRSSLYSSKARSYLFKQGIDYVERTPGDPRYTAEVMPQIGRWIIPVLQTEDGRLIQDTVDIIDHFDPTLPAERSAYPPAGSVQLVLAHVLEMFGGEGLLRPAMHYRWNFNSVNLPFTANDFGRGLFMPAGENSEGGSAFSFAESTGSDDLAKAREQVFEFAGERMRKATLFFGVNEETIPTVEASFLEFLSLFNDHLDRWPYLLGGRPTLGDFAFMGPLYAHLARDPEPGRIMQANARQVSRWVERMMAPIEDTGEYGDVPPELFPDDAIPESLTKLLGYIAKELVGETVATVGFIDDWLAENPDVNEGDVVGGKATKRSLGLVEWSWRGHQIETNVLPYRVLMLQRLQAAFESLDGAAREQALSILTEAGLSPLLDLKARRRLARADNREVWGAAQ